MAVNGPKRRPSPPANTTPRRRVCGVGDRRDGTMTAEHRVSRGRCRGRSGLIPAIRIKWAQNPDLTGIEGVNRRKRRSQNIRSKPIIQNIGGTIPMRTVKWITAVALVIGLVSTLNAQDKKKAKIPPGVEELAIGAEAPAFHLMGTDEQMHSLDDVKGEKGTLIIYTCNHCPYVKAYEDRMVDLAKTYQPQGIGVAAISCNDADAYPSDDFEAMQKRAKEKGFPFPYLYDESQAVALEYGPMVTPHIFLFDPELKLVYRGRIDNSAKPAEVEDHDLDDALTALVNGDDITVTETTAFGCSIKWKPDVLKTGKVAEAETPAKKEKDG
ncbi:MAG: redoxin domain-containing protein [candidate division Zixibacteria bacterium]|nr:redoxin domain-containing protein [candidate division Zixibacteria bacterium]